jgi:hypothetical protein
MPPPRVRPDATEASLAADELTLRDREMFRLNSRSDRRLTRLPVRRPR